MEVIIGYIIFIIGNITLKQHLTPDLYIYGIICGVSSFIGGLLLGFNIKDKDYKEN